jgi:hypothetical protein
MIVLHVYRIESGLSFSNCVISVMAMETMVIK